MHEKSEKSMKRSFNRIKAALNLENTSGLMNLLEIIASLALVVLFAACGKTETSPSQATQHPQEIKDLTPTPARQTTPEIPREKKPVDSVQVVSETEEDADDGELRSPKVQARVDEIPSTPQKTHTFSVSDVSLDAVKHGIDLSFLENYALGSHLSKEDSEIADWLATDLTGCGLSSTGPECLDSGAWDQFGKIETWRGRIVYYREMKYSRGDGASTESGIDLALVFQIDEISPKIKSSRLEIFKMNETRGGRSLETYLESSFATKLLLKASVVQGGMKEALKRIDKPQNIRELYHVGARIISLGRLNGKVREALDIVGAALVRNRRLIKASDDAFYRVAIFKLLEDGVSLAPETLEELARSGFKSSDERLKRVSATFLLEIKPERRDFKEFAAETLRSDDDWMIRRRALRALVKAAGESNPHEKSELAAILIAAEDDDEDVREALSRLTDQVTVEAGDEDVLARELKSSYWEIRLQGVVLLSRVKTRVSLGLLITAIADEDEEVRQTAFAAASSTSFSTTLDGSFVEQLAELFQKSAVDARLKAAQLLGRIQTPGAKAVLAARLDKEANKDVKQVIRESLSGLNREKLQ